MQTRSPTLNQVLQVQLLFTSALSLSDRELFCKIRDQEVSKTFLVSSLEIGLDGISQKSERICLCCLKTPCPDPAWHKYAL